MADEPEGVQAIPEPPKQTDPYDLGDTDLYPRQEVEPHHKSNSPQTESPAVPPPVGLSPSPEARERDPETGRFVKAAELAQEPVAPAAEPSYQHPDWLLDQARDLGFSEEDIVSVPSHILGRSVNTVRREQIKFRDEQAQAQTIARGEVRPQPQQAEAEPAPESELGINEEEIAPGIVQVLKAQQQRIKQLESLVGEVKQFQEQRINESRVQWVDRLIAQHGDAALFGSGPMASLKADSPEAARRQIVVDQARRIAGSKATPRDWIARIPEAITQIGHLFSPAPAAPGANGKVSQPRVSKEQWNEAALATPTHRAGAAEPKGDQKAVANLEKKMRDAGMIGDAAGDTEILETLL